MAWFQNLAGHAENLLNKIDQNAATVLNDANKQIPDEAGQSQVFRYESEKGDMPNITKPLKTSRSTTPEAAGNEEIILISALESQKPGDIATDEIKTETPIKSNQSSSSLHSSFLAAQEIENLQSKIAKLELENQDVNKQLLNFKHLYSEIRNENSNLQFQIERLNEQLSLSQNEKDQYVARAQRILQEKEKLISLQANSEKTEVLDTSIFTSYNEELKKELEFQQTKVVELTEKNAKLLNEIQSLQMQHQVIQQGLTHSNQSLEHSILNEKKFRSIAEEECAQKTKELEAKSQEMWELQNQLKILSNENIQLKEILSKKPESTENEEVENRIKSLTQTLMVNQNKLATVTTEKNALRLQLEKLEDEYKRNIAELKRDRVKVINIQETNDERISVPNFMRVSPHDAGVTRRVKRAYSTLDAISVRTGIFLRRYPVARVFVFSYMVILHMWVLTVLLWDVPSN